MGRLALLALPLAEVAVLVWVGGAVGVGPTLLWVIGAALAGAVLLRRRGREAVRALGGLRGAGRADPGAALLRLGFGVAAGALLVLPGFLSDAAALLLLLPPVQRAAARSLARRGARVVRVGPAPAPPPGPRPRAAPVIDADWEEVAPPERPPHAPPRPPSGWTRR